MAAAAAFYGIYKSVDTSAPESEQGEIACWGINACGGTTSCATAYNACTGQNSCKGKGFLQVTEEECDARGGTPLEISEADPTDDG
ncbi:MAG: BufA2 family periplasmic bufferin-type metallophore [Gammaproteobacteria bacterium]